jgi:peptide/nickel transport system permease protein
MTADLSAGARLPQGPSAGRRGRLVKRFLRHRLALASLVFLIAMAAAALAAPLIETALGADAFAVDLFNRFAPAGGANLLGTDEVGRDLLTRLLYGGRVSLAVGLTAALFSAVIGTVIGLAAGFHGGRLDALLMRVTDGVIALPILPLLIVLAAVDLTKLGIDAEAAGSESANLIRLVLIIAMVGWPTVARLVRAETLSLKTRDYVTAARAQGATPAYIMRRHILPNSMAVVVVATTLSIGNIILLESVLSFLGLGIQPPTASWGNMLTNAQELVWSAPHLAIWPGMMIFATVIAFNFLGDGLQDALDPKSGDRSAG